jgi:hypothetical protein
VHTGAGRANGQEVGAEAWCCLRAAPNTYEAPGCQETDDSSSSFFCFFSANNAGAQERVLTWFLYAGAHQTWLHQTLIEVLPPLQRRLQRDADDLCCDLETYRCPHPVLLCCRCCQAPCVFFLPGLLWTLCHIAPTGLAASCGVGTHLSPTTFYPCGLKCPSPDSLYVFRRELEGL